jgi:hypothetical protein
MRTALYRRALLASAFLGLLASAGCGSSAAPAAQATTTPAKPALLPLPTDAWAVVPDGARSFAFIDVGAARASQHFAYARTWVASACYTPEQQALLLDKTDRIVAAQWPAEGGGGERSALVAQGRYDGADVERALDLIESARGPKTASVEKAQGRFRVHTRGVLAAARIGDALLVAGDATVVDKALALAEGGAGRLREGELVTRTNIGSELTTSTALLVLSPDEAPLRRIARMLGSVGMPKDAVAGTSVVIARVGEASVTLEARIMKDDAASATRIADTVRAKLGQIGFLARLAGLPPILDRLQVQAEGTLLRAAVEASASDLAALDARLREQYGSTECGP